MAILTHENDSVRADSNPFAPWQFEMKRAIRDLDTLREALDLPTQPPPHGIAADFPVFVPIPYLNRIRKGDPDDPLLRQVLPPRTKTRPSAGLRSIPCRNRTFRPLPACSRSTTAESCWWSMEPAPFTADTASEGTSPTGIHPNLSTPGNQHSPGSNPTRPSRKSSSAAATP